MALAQTDEWRWTDDQGVQRVVHTEELRSALASNVLAPSTLVWREGMSDWVPAFTVPELGASEPQGAADGTTDVAIPLAARIAEPPPADDDDEGGVRPTAVPNETGRPTPTELLNDPKANAQRNANGNRAPRPAAGQPAVPLKIAAAPKPAAAVPRIGEAKAAPKPTAGSWRKPQEAWSAGAAKPQVAKIKSEEELTLVAEAREPFKLKAPGGDAGTPSPPQAGSAPAGAAPVGGAAKQRRPFTQTALMDDPKAGAPRPTGASRSEPPRPAAGRRSPSSIPPAPKPILPVAPSAMEPKPLRTTAFSPQAPRPAAGSPAAAEPPPLHVPAVESPLGKPGFGPPAVESPAGKPGFARSKFAITENTSTDSTGVLPLTGMYQAEPTPPNMEGSLGPNDRTASFPDTGASEDPNRAPEAMPAPQPTQKMPESALASYPPAPQLIMAAQRAIQASRPDAEAQAAAQPAAATASGAGPFRVQAPSLSAAQAAGAPAAAPVRGSAPSLNAAAASAAAPAAGSYGSPDASGYSAPPAAAGYSAPPPPMGYTAPPPPYSAPAPSISLGEPSMGASGAMPLVTVKRPGSTPPPADVPEIDGTGEHARGGGNVGDPVVVPMSSLFGAGAILIAMAVMAFFVGRCSVAKTAPSVPPARAALGALPRLAKASLPSVPKPCWMAKQPVRWAPAVLQSIPAEVAPSTSGVIVAFAQDERTPATVEVDFGTGTFVEKPSDPVAGKITRVFAPREGAPLAVTTEGDSGPLSPYVYSPSSPRFVIGLSGKGTATAAVAAADKADGTPVTLWTMPAIEKDKGLEAPRVIATGPSQHAVVFRRGGSIFGGYVGEGLKPVGALGSVTGSGGSVGKPSLGATKREVAVVFADQAADKAPWEIRAGHAPLGEIPKETAVVPLPKGGPGGEAFAPDIAGTADGRWVLVWTEGRQGAYAVRAQTLGPDFKPLGDPIAISPPAGNFGQAIVGVAGNYVTTMFLSKAASSYELWGAVLQCGL